MNEKRHQFDVINKQELIVEDRRGLKYSFRAYTMIIVLFAAINILPLGLSGLAAGKELVWSQTNILYIISLYGAYPSFAYGIHNNDKWVWVPSLLIELTIFFAGSRAFATTMIIIFLCEEGFSLWKKNKGNLQLFILGGAGVVFLVLYRMIDTLIMAGDITGVVKVLKDPQTWATALQFNEPRVIIANYDYVFTSHVQLPLADVIYRIADFIPGLNKLLGLPITFPEYFSDWLMNQVQGSAGVGSTFWGECYAMFGFVGIIMFTIIWLLFINWCNNHFRFMSSYSYFIVSIGAYLAWYINRLDFNRVAQACKIMFLCFLLWVFVYLLVGGTLRINNRRIYIKEVIQHK